MGVCHRQPQPEHQHQTANQETTDDTMMRAVSDAVVTFVTLGFTEAVVKPIAKALVQKSMKRALPYVYERLDNEMPTLLKTTPLEMVAEFGAAIEQATGQPATRKQIAYVARNYDPLRAVLRNVQQ
jgi:hypothetical protein